MFVAAVLFVLTGSICFILGALTQQNISYRRIRAMMMVDPYVFRCRQNIFKALAFLGKCTELPIILPTQEAEEMEQEESEENRIRQSEMLGSVSILEKFALWSRAQANKMIAFMSLSVAQEDSSHNEIEPVEDIMKYGFPGMDEIHVYKNFVLSYDRRNRIAHWVCEHIKKEFLTNVDPRTVHKPNEYITDHSIPATFSPNMRDFRNSDWVGGHMASPQNYKCDMIRFVETYKFPNIIPISRGLKNHLWKRLEQYVREQAHRFGSVYVYTGPLFMPQRISFRNWAVRHHVMGMNTVAVPTHFFKVVISEQTDDTTPIMEGYVLPNTDVDKDLDLRSFSSDIRDIEHFAGLKFYDGQQRSLFVSSLISPYKDYDT